MVRHHAHALIAFIALLTTAACGPLPRPFAHDTNAPAPPVLTTPVDAEALAVLPVANVEPPADGWLAAEIAHQLKQADIPARALRKAPASGLRLQGRLIDVHDAGRAARGGEADIERESITNITLGFAWNLLTPDGKMIERRFTSFDVPAAAWDATHNRNATAQTIRTLGAEIVTALKPLMDKVGECGRDLGSCVAAEPRALGAPLTVALRRVDGAPGDGKTSLTQAMTRLLTAQGAVVVADTAPADFVLTGVVVVKPSDTPKTDQVTIVWSVFRNNGDEVASIQQANEVPLKALNGRWGATALAVAQASADPLLIAMRNALPMPAIK